MPKKAGKQPKLRGNLLLKYSASIFEMQAAQAKLEAKEAEIGRKADQSDEYSRAIQDLTMRVTLQEDLSKVVAKVTAVARQVSEKLGVEYEDFKNYTIDTETGQVLYVPVKEKAENG